MIGDDSYTRMINKRLRELDMKYAIDNQYTPLIDHYSGLQGGARPRLHLLPGNSSSGYPIIYPESYGIAAGARQRKTPRQPKKSLMYRYEEEFLQPTNGPYPSVIPVGGSLHSRTPRKGSKSKTHHGELDYTTKKGSLVHHIKGHYVKAQTRPFEGGKRKPLSLKNIGRSLKKDFAPVVKVVKKVGKFIAPALPVVGSELGSLAGESLAIASENPELVPVGRKVGSFLGNKLGQYAKKKLGGKRTLRHTSSHNKTPKKKTNARAEIVKKVMDQHGLGMIEASKFVKLHGLY